MEVKYQVFVSSTYNDLKEERKEATQAILEAHCIPAGMELFPASSKAQWEVIKQVIDDSDFYMLIIAGKYGSTGTDDNGNKISYTEMEYDYAVAKGKPILALLYDDIEELPKSKSEISAAKNRKLKKFREKACTGRLIKKWNNKDNLKSAALAALVELKSTTKETGWIRADFRVEQQSYLFLEEQREKYESEISLLKSQISQNELKTLRLEALNGAMEEDIIELRKREDIISQMSAPGDGFWLRLARLNMSYEYEVDNHRDLLDDLAAECQLTPADRWFFGQYNNSFWHSITASFIKMAKEYKQLSVSKRKERIRQLDKMGDQFLGKINSKEIDFFSINEDKLKELISTTFFLVYICFLNGVSGFEKSINETKGKFASICDWIITNCYEIELALRENDAD